MTAIVVGVDGGGTKTLAMVADERGTEIVTVDGGPSAVRPGQVDASATRIAAVVRDAMAAAGLAHTTPRVVCVGVAGVGRAAEREGLRQALASADIGEEVVVQTDASIALDDAFADAPGVLLIAGTGSIAYGRGPTGILDRCGGWGPVIGDEGGGAWIGRRALGIVAGAHDGREPSTSLIGAILTAAEVDQVDDLIPWATSASPAMLAGLVPAVTTAADNGDLRANALLSLAVEELGLHVRTLARRLFGDEQAAAPVALGGGLLAPGAPIRTRLEHRLKSLAPGAQLRAAEVVAVRGAVRGALRFLGVSTS